MNKQEAKEILEAIRNNRPADSAKFLDMVFKFMSTASLLLLAWVLTTVNQMQGDMIQQRADISYMRNNMEKLEDFTSKPRFTQEQFDYQLVPVLKSISQLVEDKIDIENEIDKIKVEIQQLRIDLANKKSN